MIPHLQNSPDRVTDSASFRRGSGVLLHISCLPGSGGIGTLGPPAFRFVDWLAAAKQRYWQICPICPTGFGNSPYQGLSAFAGNTFLIDLEDLLSLGLLKRREINLLENEAGNRGAVDFRHLIPQKNALLNLAWERYNAGAGADHQKIKEYMEQFKTISGFWLNDYALFQVIKKLQKLQPWNLWPHELRMREGDAMRRVKQAFRTDIDEQIFMQFLFHRQWKALVQYAKNAGVQIIGDMPLFVAYDSSDCWSRPNLFQLDENRLPLFIAGVPPDYFSETGQLWGNPLYNWDVMQDNGFEWWLYLIEHHLKHFSILRIDHFRGFQAYWSIKYGAATAVEGQWVSAPGEKLFERMQKCFRSLPLIAEDLGVITNKVRELMKRFGLPGMKVLQFAFDSSENNPYLPHLYTEDSVAYTGTHDNQCSLAWLRESSKEVIGHLREYFNISADAEEKAIVKRLVEAVMESAACIAIVPLQDALILGKEARLNRPGTMEGNWLWRAEEHMLDEKLAQWLGELAKKTKRME